MQGVAWFTGTHKQVERVSTYAAQAVEVPGVGEVLLVRTVDCLGAMCPRPQLLTLKVLSEVEPGEVIEVVSDNPTAVEGFPALAQTLYCTHLATVRSGDSWRIYLRKGL
jgi:TusA-related sulfurtransferase